MSVGSGTESAGRGGELKAVGQVGRSRVADALIAKGSDIPLRYLQSGKQHSLDMYKYKYFLMS